MIRYQLRPLAAARRARAVAAIEATTVLAPLVLAAEMTRRAAPSFAFWGVAVALTLLVLARAWVHAGSVRRRLESLHIALDDESIGTIAGDEALTLARNRVTRIVEIDGALGGLRVESELGGSVALIRIPSGGEAFEQVREHLERWRRIERKPRRGRTARFGLAILVVGAIFFLPFLLDDVIGRSRWGATSLVLVAWLAVRWTLRAR